MTLLFRTFVVLTLPLCLVPLAVGPAAAQPDAAEPSAAAQAAPTQKDKVAARRAAVAARRAAQKLRNVRNAVAAPTASAAPGPERAVAAPAATPAAVQAPTSEAPPPPPTRASRRRPSNSRRPSADEIVEVPGEKEFNSCRKLPGQRRIVKLNLKPETALNELVSWISSITCTQFLIPGTTVLSGKKVTIVSPKLITPSEAYRLFLAAIESVGLTVEPIGGFLRIVETNRARFTQLPFLKDGAPLPADKRYVTRFVRLAHIDAGTVTQAVLQRLKGEQGDIIPFGHDVLIITDQAVMVRKLLKVIDALDTPGDDGERMWMVRVKNTSVIEMAARLAEIFSVNYVGQGYTRGRKGAAKPAPKPATPPRSTKFKPPGERTLGDELMISKLIPVERSNHLIVVAKPVSFEWLKVMVERLDVPLEGGNDRVNIYYCKYANCDELAVTLGSVTGIPVAISAAGGRRGGRNASPRPTPARPSNQNQPDENMMFEGALRINYDRPTNSLVIVSSFKDYQVLRDIIEQLDQPRKQVFVEALIMEVLLDKSRELGAAYHAGAQVGTPGSDEKSLLIGGFRANQTLNPTSVIGGGALDGLAGTLLGPVLDQTVTGELFGTAFQVPSFGLFLQALQRNNDVNVLSNPYLIITNNEEGELSVGQNIPFPGAFLGGGAGAAGGLTSLIPSVSVQRQDVAMRLTLVPSVNEHDLIRMEVDQEISDIASTNFNGLGPSTTKRTARTTVVTRDQQTVLIGGLMSDRTSQTVQKIPILGDIPILGFFFRNRSTQRVKSNIIIALTPYVITEPEDLSFVVEKKMRERREFIERYTAFNPNNPLDDAEVDYSKKRGMLEVINKTITEMEDEESSIRRIRDRDAREQSEPIMLPADSRNKARAGGAAANEAARADEGPSAALIQPSNEPSEDGDGRSVANVSPLSESDKSPENAAPRGATATAALLPEPRGPSRSTSAP